MRIIQRIILFLFLVTFNSCGPKSVTPTIELPDNLQSKDSQNNSDTTITSQNSNDNNSFQSSSANQDGGSAFQDDHQNEVCPYACAFDEQKICSKCYDRWKDRCGNEGEGKDHTWQDGIDACQQHDYEYDPGDNQESNNSDTSNEDDNTISDNGTNNENNPLPSGEMFDFTDTDLGTPNNPSTCKEPDFTKYKYVVTKIRHARSGDSRRCEGSIGFSVRNQNNEPVCPVRVFFSLKPQEDYLFEGSNGHEMLDRSGGGFAINGRHWAWKLWAAGHLDKPETWLSQEQAETEGVLVNIDNTTAHVDNLPYTCDGTKAYAFYILISELSK